MREIDEIGKRAKAASLKLALLTDAQKNKALKAIANELVNNCGKITGANALDIALAKDSGLAPALIDRLTLTETGISDVAKAVMNIAELEDPVGQIISETERPNGLKIQKRRVPFGVIGIIYESRPNVTVDAAAIALKAGNAVILRGGSDAINTNRAIVAVMRQALNYAGLDADSIILIEDTSRERVLELMRLTEYVDLLIPRGGASLIRSVVENATVPVIETGTGNCHVYVDNPCDNDMAINIIVNAKASRPSVCNAAETLLVHKGVAKKFLPEAQAALAAKNVKLLGCAKTRQILPDIAAATDEDFATEFLDYILAVKVVDSIEDAIEHIAKYSTRHSEAIVTDNEKHAAMFANAIDAAAIYINASTRFTDGGEFGFGAEMGISTQKLHARGPMGLVEMTTYKYVVYGSGQVR